MEQGSNSLGAFCMRFGSIFAGLIFIMSVASAACSDSDGGINYFVKGTVVASTGKFTDFCTGGMLTEYYCSADPAGIANPRVANITKKCLYGCSNGACQSQIPYCNDSDGGMNFFTQGTVTSTTGVFTDFCMHSMLAEFYCNGTAMNSTTSACAYGCQNGACMNQTACACGTLSIPNYICTLASDLASSGTCFTINAANVTIRCAGHKITGSNVGYGIYSSKSNSTVQNCIISNFSSGVYFVGAANSTIRGVVSNNNSDYGIALGASPYSTIYNSTGISNTSPSGGISIGSSPNATIANCAAFSNTGRGIIIMSSPNTTIANSIGISNTGMGIYVSSSPNSAIINTTATSSGMGIFIGSSPNAVIKNSAGNSIGSVGIALNSNDNTTIINFTGTSNSSAGISLGSSNSAIINSAGISNTGTGISIVSSSNNTITSSIGASNSGYGIVIGSSSNITVKNSRGASNGSNCGILLYASSSSLVFNSTFINPPGPLACLSGNSGGNIFFWNNFTGTSGMYVQDYLGGNFYNATTPAGTNEGNIYCNVMGGQVQISGTAASAGFSQLYIGASGTGYPYDSTHSLGKVSATVQDNKPLTPFN